MSRRDHGITDAHALRLITEGRILCDPATGVILVDGQPRGTSDKRTGYQKLYAAGVHMQAHRVLWMFVHGPIPKGHVINHRDKNRANNRISNLEAITHQQNLMHARRHPGYVGTYPGDTVDAAVATAAIRLAAKADDVRREELLAILGVEPEAVRDDTEHLMQTIMDIEPRRSTRLA